MTITDLTGVKNDVIFNQLDQKLMAVGNPLQRVEVMFDLILLNVFEKRSEFEQLKTALNEKYLFSYLQRLTDEQIKTHLETEIIPFYSQILSYAGRVYRENLPQRFVDALFLIEDVYNDFDYSKLSKIEGIKEVINLIADFDVDLLFWTNKVSDVIELAFKLTDETNLYHTPKRVRQLMTAIVDPNFRDRIFDPFCGAGSFLVDAYNYCIEKVSKKGVWLKNYYSSNQEIDEFFNYYFSKSTEKMPDYNTANKFYWEGLRGAESSKIIKKLAMINCYFRGIKTGNIDYGDALQFFNPKTDTGTKTVVISNPFSRILEEININIFVKMALDLLKKGGRCALIVPEEFLTSDEAKETRDILLEQANLRAVISLPSDIFKDKQGQSIKTSILYFEKGEPTKWTWHYKIDNEGYINGDQITEAIDKFHVYVKKGEIPPETKR